MQAVATALATQFQELRQETADFFAPYLEIWLPLEVTAGHLTPEDAQETFFLESITDKGLLFISEPWEEYECLDNPLPSSTLHPSRHTTIPLDFFDDPHRYEKLANDKRDSLERAKKDEQIRTEQRKIKDLQEQIAISNKKIKSLAE